MKKRLICFGWSMLYFMAITGAWVFVLNMFGEKVIADLVDSSLAVKACMPLFLILPPIVASYRLFNALGLNKEKVKGE